MQNKIDFLYVGGHKCGSTWLHDVLIEHPEICPPKQKEPNFFNLNYQQGFKYYDKLWSGKGLRGEFSTSYFTEIKNIERIYNYNPDIKILITLRNPLDRTISHIRHWNRLTPKNLDEPELIIKFLDQNPEIIQRSKYAQNIKNVLYFFPPKQINFNFFDDILSAPDMVFKNTLKFLNLECSKLPNSLYKKSAEGFLPRSTNIEKLRNYVFQYLQKFNMQKSINLLKNLGLGVLYRQLNSTKKKKNLIIPKKIYKVLIEDLNELKKINTKFSLNLNVNYINNWSDIIKNNINE